MHDKSQTNRCPYLPYKARVERYFSSDASEKLKRAKQEILAAENFQGALDLARNHVVDIYPRVGAEVLTLGEEVPDEIILALYGDDLTAVHKSLSAGDLIVSNRDGYPAGTHIMVIVGKPSLHANKKSIIVRAGDLIASKGAKIVYKFPGLSAVFIFPGSRELGLRSILEEFYDKKLGRGSIKHALGWVAEFTRISFGVVVPHTARVAVKLKVAECGGRVPLPGDILLCPANNKVIGIILRVDGPSEGMFNIVGSLTCDNEFYLEPGSEVDVLIGMATMTGVPEALKI